MEKIKYEKPIVLDLNGNTANGGPLSCVPGGSASGDEETCVGGTGAGWSCQSGSSGGSYPACSTGNGVSGFGDCTFGLSPSGGWGLCEGGSQPNTNFFGCNVGPSAG